MATQATQLVVSFMKTTEDKEYKKTCCRALRLLGHSEKHRKKLVEEGGLFPVACLVKEEDEALMDCGLRALSELSNKCSIECAKQVQNAGAMSRLVELVQEKDPTSKQYSFSLKILMNLTEQANARPSVGNAGGITLFLSLFKDDTKGNNKVPLLNALCLFCREAVNRVRIRELGILDVLLKALRDDSLAVLHGRIVSAFVCFIYDDPSLIHLLSLGLIGTLLEHFQSSAAFSSTQNVALRDSIEARAQDSVVMKRGVQSPDSIKAPGKRRKVETEDSGTIFDFSDKETRKWVFTEKMNENQDKLFVGSGNDEVFKPAEEKAADDSASRTPVKTPGAEGSTQKSPSRHQHVYSIDSPTYEAQYSKWSLDNFKSSVKCKQSFTPESLHSRSSSPDRLGLAPSPSSSYPDTYSPLSVTSCYSPDYSPQYSPLYQAYLTPVSSPLGTSVSSPLGSPQRCSSPSLLSDTKEQIAAAGDDGGKAWEYSSEEGSSEEIQSTSSAAAINLTEHSKDTPACRDQPSFSGVTRNRLETGNCNTKRNLNRSLEEFKSGLSKNAEIFSSSNLKEGTCNSNRKEVKSSSGKSVRKQKSSICKVTEENILIFLSRVSQMPDPSKFLVSEECLCGLLDYISLSEKPCSRAGRILRRLFNNPHCLEPLLDVLAPVYVRDKLCGGDIDDSGQMNETVTAKSARNSQDGRQGRRKSSVSEPEDTPDPVCLSASALGATLMQDLSFVVESQYGRGTVAHVLKRKPEAQKTRCVICLPFLCRSKPSQQKTLFDDGALRQLLDLFKTDSYSEMQHVAVQGLHFLCHNSDVKLKLPERKFPFPTDETAKALSLSFATDAGLSVKPPSCPDCVYAAVSAFHDLTFVLEGDTKCSGSRAVLVGVCPVFQAMLKGDYSESRQSEITIHEVSADAFQFLMHFFHGCGPDCGLVKRVIEAEFPLYSFLDVMSLADRYLLLTLERYLATKAKQEYLNMSTLSDLYHFAVIHNYSTLADDCLRFLLTHEVPSLERLHYLEDLLSQGDSRAACEHIYYILRSNAFGTRP
ncbi:armadillo repeat-containing protein 5-like [Liolophura sinensis]|uniref:armadillo repeat-containing protein 5-like n=1 Tax=Liolophura sinensis TaxID=3198878 RepID=UPI0031580CF7